MEREGIVDLEWGTQAEGHKYNFPEEEVPTVTEKERRSRVVALLWKKTIKNGKVNRNFSVFQNKPKMGCKRRECLTVDSHGGGPPRETHPHVAYSSGGRILWINIIESLGGGQGGVLGESLIGFCRHFWVSSQIL